jgi:hypothetical protein
MGFLDQIKNAVEKLAQPREAFDPSRFDDPVATETKWSPAKGGGTNVGTHALRTVSNQRVEFKVRILALLFPGVFMLAGLGVMVGVTSAGISKGEYGLIAFGAIFGLVFFLVGFFIMRSWTTPRVFDKRNGLYWRGRREPVPGMRDGGAKEQCKLEDIHAIQLIREYCRGSSSSSGGRSKSYYSYELNLVLQDGARINVVDHGKHNLIRDDARQLGEFLDVPVWDAS